MKLSFNYYFFGFIHLVSTYLLVQHRVRTIQSTCALWAAKALQTAQSSCPQMSQHLRKQQSTKSEMDC